MSVVERMVRLVEGSNANKASSIGVGVAAWPLAICGEEDWPAFAGAS